ncbi:hypothetical protein AVEN_83040-1 [Araneus ventricosus]|uniref:Uncharacterized protein n=1 Tax=Araneus ventricosus TaxID=182803 RepID=A0A4Y2TH39_ARAVE|nr:hypothetical protein AVEN_40444-1 [Araneus ventricosus]GBN98719.1 hypothetical protein AVEN_83040-1 [Araneus ventricosus]
MYHLKSSRCISDTYIASAILSAKSPYIICGSASSWNKKRCLTTNSLALLASYSTFNAFMTRLSPMGGAMNTRMSSCRISKQELASPGCTRMVGGVLPPSSDSTYLLREGSGRGQVIGYWDSGLSTRAIAATVIQCSRMPRQDGVSLCGCGYDSIVKFLLHLGLLQISTQYQGF